MGFLIGCYAPTLPENQPCTEEQNCPEGLTCDIATNECVSEVPPGAHFIQMSSFGRSACGIDPEGALWCWGDNQSGQLGLGDRDKRLAPSRVGTESDWLFVGAGENITCGLRALDQLWCWGDGGFDSSYGTRPEQVSGSYKTLTVGHDAWCAVDSSDVLTCHRRGGQPEVQPFSGKAVKIAAAHDTTCVIDDAQQLFCWGDNSRGQLGNGQNFGFLTADAPHQITGTFQQVELGEDHACALQTDGVLSCWGSCNFGQLGRGDSIDCFTPTAVAEDALFSYVDAGTGHTCAISGGKLYCFGRNNVGQLGQNGGASASDPIELLGFDEWTSVTLGASFTCGIRGETNEAWCWGTNERGELGDGGGGVVLEPTFTDAGPYETVDVGDQIGCAIRTDGTLWCWGSNSFGQLGDGSTFERRRPVQVGTDADWIAVATARTSTCGIRAPGTLWCWGNNDDAQAGIGGTPPQLSVPTQVGVATGWTEIAVGDDNACGVLDGILHCWGDDRGAMPESLDLAVTSLRAFDDVYAAVLNGVAIEFLVFQPDPGMQVVSASVTNWNTIDVGDDHLCGLIGDGLFCFGNNFDGQGGVSDTTPKLEAVQESTGGRWVQVATGSQATCAIATDGHLACFGVEHLIGNGNDGNQFVPTTIGTAQWKSISVGGDNTCGIQIDGSLHCWGAGNSSGRGDGLGGHERPTRVAVPQ